jgi:two-component SAPR family response regulator
MYQNEAIKLAETILQLDQLRDELYEELMKTMGSKGNELLRALQNL